MKNDLISIIVPIYNISAYLERCVNSIIHQTYLNLEIILVNDGSTDESIQICDEFEKKDNRIQVIHKENAGLVSARKIGLLNAHGEYIGFVDGDDWIEPKMYQHFSNVINETEADIIMQGYIEDINGKSGLQKNKINVGIYEKNESIEKVYTQMLCDEPFFSMGIQPYIWNKLIKRDIVYKNLMEVDNQIKIGEDAAVVFPSILDAEKIVITDECDYHYCIRNTSMMWANRNEEKELQGIHLFDMHLRNVVQTHGMEDMFEEQLNHYLINNLLTRSYSKVANLNGDNIIWPFGWKNKKEKCIVYGAGYFGRALYQYLNAQNKVSLWVDRDYEKYCRLELPVSAVEEVYKHNEDILVAVLNNRVAKDIKESLIRMGIKENRIYLVGITQEDMGKIKDLQIDMNVR